MGTKRFLRNLIIGKKHYIPARSDYKNSLLRGQLTILGLFTTLIYIFADLNAQVYSNLPIYYAFIAITILVLFLNRAGKYLIANIILLTSINFVVYLFASRDPNNGGVVILFVTSALAAVSLFGYRQLIWGLFFVSLSFCLFLLAYFVEISLLERANFTEAYTTTNYFTNFTVGFVVSVLIMLFLLDINHHSETALRQKEENLMAITEELKRSRQRFEMAIAGSKAGIYEWEKETNSVFVSPYYKQLLGYSPDELDVKGIEDYQSMIHPEDQALVAASMKSHFETRQSFNTELRLRTKSGDYKWFSDSGLSVFSENGAPSVVVGSIIDISERKKAEQRIIEQNELLAKTNAELDRFVYSTSHDLRAPLSSILGLISIAEKTADPEEVKQCLGMMKDRIHNLEGFIREIIDYSRNSRVEVKKEPVNLYNLISEVVENLRFAEGSESIFVKYDIDKNLELHTDEGRLKVILNNLVGNSIKYSDAEKENQFISVKALTREDKIQILIEDNGVGISQEHHARIFDMFYRASEKSQGSGLGLYIVKETIQKLGGSVIFESTLGQGTKFEITLYTK